MEAKSRIDAALIAAVVGIVTANAALAEDAKTTSTTAKTTTASDKKDGKAAAKTTTKAETTKSDGTTKTVKATEKTTKKTGKESACGKGSCGTDEKGAKAASDAHAKVEVKTTTKTEKK